MTTCKLKFIAASVIGLYIMACVISHLVVTHGLLDNIGPERTEKDQDKTSLTTSVYGFRNSYKRPQILERKNVIQQHNYRMKEIFRFKNNEYENDIFEDAMFSNVENHLGKKKDGHVLFPLINPKVTSSRSKMRTHEKDSKYIVPNIVHYISFSKDNKWTFNQMLSVKSAYLKIKPEIIYFHCEIEPAGSWWTYVKENIKTLKVIRVNAPTKIFNQSIAVEHHKSDIYRLKVLQKYGGIFLDSNIVVLKSFDTFRIYNFTMGIMSKPYKHVPGKLDNAVLISALNAPFLNLWYNTYQSYKSKERPLDYHSCIIPYHLKIRFPTLINTEEHSLIFPSNNVHLFVYQRSYHLQHTYSVKLIFNPTTKTFDPLTMQSSNTTFGYLLRLIYYENKPFSHVSNQNNLYE